MPGGWRGSFERVVILAGLTGLGLDSVVDFVREEVVGGSGGVNVSKFEDYLRREYGGAPIERIAALMLSSSRSVTLEKFSRAFSSLVEDARGSERLVVSMHLSYFTQNMLVPNPAVGYAVESAGRAVIVYFVEDYYDAIRRVRDKVVSEGDPDVARPRLHLDPITYLSWRGAEHNMITMLRSFYGGKLEAFIVGIKHPRPTLRRLLEDAIWGSRRLHVYYSHPITLYRKLARLGGRGLVGVPGVGVVEAVKGVLRGFEEVVLYEPTSVDELITTSRGEACRAAGEVYGGGGGGGGGEVVSPVVGPGDRWPVPPDTIHDDYPYTRGLSFNLAGEDMAVLYPEFARELAHNYCSRLSYIVERLRSLIVSQVEMRDYSYIEQSRATIVVAPLFYSLRAAGSEGGGCRVAVDMWLYIAQGVEAEVRRAHSLASRVVVLVVPQHLESTARELCGGDGGCAASVAGEVRSGSQRLPTRTTIIDCGCMGEALADPTRGGGDCGESREAVISTMQEALSHLVDPGDAPLALSRAGDTAILVRGLQGLDEKLRRALGLPQA